MRILFIGDIVGESGLDYTGEILKELCADVMPDLVIANGENVAKGHGLTKKTAEELYEAGVEIITLGNHTFDQKELSTFIDSDARIVRPSNYPPGTPGRGHTVCKVNGKDVLIVNLIGRTFIGTFDCPFRAIDEILNAYPNIRHIIVDMHAEATSEKLVMGWHLAGRASAVLGTHTHVPTSDARVLPGGTAYITDVGMVGPRDGILGMRRDEVATRMIRQMPARFVVADGPRQFCSVVIELDDETGRATRIDQEIRNESL